MLSEAATPGTDDWMLEQLATKLGQSFHRKGVLKAHYEGEPPVVDGAEQPQVRRAYQRLLKLGRLNFARLIVSAVTSRMVPVGFRSATGDEDVDQQAMALWDQSHMPVESRDMFEDLCVYGEAYGVVASDGMRHFSPWNVAVDGTRPWDLDAALIAEWVPNKQVDRLTLLRRESSGRVYVRDAVRPSTFTTIPSNGTVWFPGRDWTWEGNPRGVDVPWADRIPVVQFLAPGGLGQFEPHLATLDRINTTIFQRLVIEVMQAFHQRAVSGPLPQRYTEDVPPRNGHRGHKKGERIDYDKIFRAGPAAMWMLPQGAQIWESQTTDVSSITTSIAQDVKHLAAVSSTPLYVLSPDAQTGSAEGASLARETLVYKTEDLMARASDGLAAMMNLRLAAQENTRPTSPPDLEVLWAPADRVSIDQKGQAASQLRTVMPEKTVWREVLQFTPDQIRRAEQDQAEEAYVTPDTPAQASASTRTGVSGGGSSNTSATQ